MQRGVLNTTHTALTATPVKEQDWTLDATGNWSGFIDKVNGTIDLNQTRTANKVNEITAIGATTGPTWVTPQYDQAGNTIRFPQVADPTQGFTAVYDAWNRMVSVSSTGGGGSSSSSSSSSGGALSSSSSSSRSSSSSAGGSFSSSSSSRSSSSSGGFNSSSSSNSGSSLVAQYRYDGRGFRILKYTYTSGALSETRHFYFTSSWQAGEERVGTSTAMSYQYVWGARYIDELVCRDGGTASPNTPSSSSASSTGNQRFYSLQDANFNVTATVMSSSPIAERYLFDPYGKRKILSSAWMPLSVSAFIWSFGHQGLCDEVESGLVYNRNRYLHPVLGVFLGRDVLEYYDDPSLYCYVSSNPMAWTDWSGTEKAEETDGEATPNCTDEVILSDEGWWRTHHLPKPGNCSAYGVLACFADVFNRQPDEDGKPGAPSPDIIPDWPSIRGPIGIGFDPRQKASDAEKRHGNQYKLDASAGAYNGGRGVAPDPNHDKNFHDLFTAAIDKAEKDAMNRAANCDKCKCPYFTVIFKCNDPQARDWGHQLWQYHQVTWGPSGKKYHFDGQKQTLCNMWKRIECRK